MVKVNEIFESISGEAGITIPQGQWCTIIRLQGCNLNCHWCDTQRARPANSPEMLRMTPEAICDEVQTKHVLVTGGEPLVQSETEEMLDLLIKLGHVVQVETNGSVQPFPPGHWSRYSNRLGWVIDYKCLSSGMDGYMLSLDELATILYGRMAVLKFVVANPEDLDFAFNRIRQLIEMIGHTPWLDGRFLISPINGKGNVIPRLVEQIRSYPDGNDLVRRIIFSVQIHKLLNLA